MREGVFRTMEITTQICPQHLLKAFFRQFPQRIKVLYRGIVDQDIDPSKSLHSLLDHCLHLVRLSHIRSDPFRAAAKTPDF